MVVNVKIALAKNPGGLSSRHARVVGNAAAVVTDSHSGGIAVVATVPGKVVVVLILLVLQADNVLVENLWTDCVQLLLLVVLVQEDLEQLVVVQVVLVEAAVLLIVHQLVDAELVVNLL